MGEVTRHVATSEAPLNFGKHVRPTAVPLPISIVNACLRDGRGGSPTAVIDDSALTTLTDSERSQVAVRCGTSHAVFVTRRVPHSAPTTHNEGRAAAKESTVDLRFFTAEGGLPACGHGTIAAAAFLAQRHQGAEHEFNLCVSGRTFTARAVREGDQIHAAFDPGPVTLREPTSAEIDHVVAALGVSPDLLAPGACVASLGRARMLVPVATPEAVAALTPELDQLHAACDQFGLLGCYVYSTLTSAGRVMARMFAPSIGVPEDIANANSTACLAAHLAVRGVTDLSVDMGDALGSPATITASTRQSPTGPKIFVGGVATITGAGAL
jgi:PhzF family phenazine biosynthesis protein